MVPKEEPKVEPKVQPKSELKVELKPQVKLELKTEKKTEMIPDVKAQAEEATKKEVKKVESVRDQGKDTRIARGLVKLEQDVAERIQDRRRKRQAFVKWKVAYLSW